MNEPTHDELKELIAPYVLGAVDDDERALVRAHILSCEECMRRADDLTEVTPWLDRGVEPASLPAGFADRVVAAARADVGAGAGAEVLPLRKGTWAWPLAAAALVVAVAILAFSLWDARADLARQKRVVAALASDEGFEITGAGAIAKMVPTDDGGLFVAAGLGEAPSGRTYQLWLIRGSRPTSAGVFEPADGTATLEVDRPLDGVDSVAVTVEPEGGSPEPTTTPIMSTS